MNRQPHVVIDLSTRQHKALKIERLLGLQPKAVPIRLLEIGTGSGGIAHYFATHASLRCEVDAVDVVDNRVVHECYRYRLVEGVELPFAADTFDVVISNHVIEHVGEADAQLAHLREIRRVLKDDGVGYLAVPNRWMVTEPHYRLKFLSWLPRRWRSPYLRWSGKGDAYDCEPLSLGQLERMLAEAGLSYRNICIQALRETLAIEQPAARATHLLRRVPDALLWPLRGLIPTLVHRLEKDDHGR